MRQYLIYLELMGVKETDFRPTLAQVFANSSNIAAIEESLRNASSYQQQLALSYKLAACKGRAAAYKTTLRATTTSYRGYDIKPSFERGMYIVIGKHFLCFASDVQKAKRLIDERVTSSAAV